jgi:uncharacterized protein YuzE
MNLTIDQETNVAYILLGESRPSVRQTVLDRMQIIVDWDEDGGIVGFELLNARTQLGKLWDEALSHG